MKHEPKKRKFLIKNNKIWDKKIQYYYFSSFRKILNRAKGISWIQGLVLDFNLEQEKKKNHGIFFISRHKQ